MERFDPREGNKCVQVKAMKESRSRAAAAEHKGRIYVTGGLNLNYLETVEMFAFFIFSYFLFKFALLTDIFFDIYLFRHFF